MLDNTADPVGEISFHPVTAADLPVLAEWLSRPHWREWWGDPETELGYIRDMIEGRDGTSPYLFHVDGVPAGYIQVWSVVENRIEPWLTEAPWLMWLPDDSVGIDLSVASPDRLSRGVGSAALRAMVKGLRNRGHQNIIIDPDPENARAIAAYRKAGFHPVPELLGRTPDCVIMQHIMDETNI